MQKSTVIRRLGWVLICIGAFLTLFMTGLTVLVGNIVFNPGDSKTSTHFTGTPQDMIFMFGIFGLVLVFGVAGIAAGIYQVKYGKRNMKLTMVVLGLGLLFIAIGMAVRLGGSP